MITALAAGCATQDRALHLEYTFELANATDQDPLRLEDERFVFDFVPSRSGVLFNIRNKSKERAKLLWDGTYFVDPDLNTFRALNTDILRESSEVVEKAKYESVIAPNSSLRRFTTSSVAATGPNALELRAAVDRLATRRSYWDSSSSSWEWAGPQTVEVSPQPEAQPVSIPQVSWQIAECWPSQITPSEDQTNENALKHLLAHSLAGRETMAIGFQLSQGPETKEYHFVFNVSSVFSYHLVSHTEKYIDDQGNEQVRNFKTRELAAVLRNNEGDWTLEVIRERQLPDPNPESDESDSAAAN